MKKYPDIAVDVVLFSYFKERLNVLLIRRSIKPYLGNYALPGVLLKENETTEEAAFRALSVETNVNVDYLEQLYTFSELDRDPRQRIISVSYFGLINQSKHELPIANSDAFTAEWIDCDKIQYILGNTCSLGEFAFDHLEIYLMALTRLKTKIQYEPIGLGLLHEYFTLGELHKLYETILQKNIDRRNFTRKVMSYGLIKKTPHKTSGHVGRKSQLFEFDMEMYKTLKENGLYFEI